MIVPVVRPSAGLMGTTLLSMGIDSPSLDTRNVGLILAACTGPSLARFAHDDEDFVQRPA